MSRCCCPTTRRKQFRCVHLVACRPMVQHSSARRRLRKPSLFESKNHIQGVATRGSWTGVADRHCWQKLPLEILDVTIFGLAVPVCGGWSDTLNDLSNWGTEIQQSVTTASVTSASSCRACCKGTFRCEVGKHEKLQSHIFISEGKVGQVFPKYQPLFGLR